MPLDNPRVSPPRGSIAYAALEELKEDGYHLTVDPRTGSDVTEQYMLREYAPPNARDDYLGWRERRPNLHLFLLANTAGRLAVASWIMPITAVEPGSAPKLDLQADAVTNLDIYEGDLDVAKRFLQVTHAYARRRLPFVGRGILMPVNVLPVVSICDAIGYKAAAYGSDPKSGIASIDMVVSSESLDKLNATSYKPAKPPAKKHARPGLRIVWGDKGD